MDKISIAVYEGNDTELERLYLECGYWYDGLNASDRLEVDETLMRWEKVNMVEKYAVVKKLNELSKRFNDQSDNSNEPEPPTCFDTEQFMELIRTTYCQINVEREGEYYIGTWSHDYNYATIVYLNGEYYICVNGAGGYHPILVTFENAGKAMSWLENTYSRLLDIEQKAIDAEVDKIEEDITLAETDAFYVIKETYNRDGPKYRVITDPWIYTSKVWVEPEDGIAQIIYKLGYYGDLYLMDENYHAMMAALKSRHVMKKKFEVLLKKEWDRERRKKELEDSIY